MRVNLKRLLSLAGSIVLTSLGLASAATLSVGDPAPAFEAESTRGTVQLVELTDRGPVVLAFYYADFTPA